MRQLWTLEDLAIDSAQALLRQWETFRPNQFVFTEDDAPSIVDVADDGDTLLRDLIALSKKEKNDWYPVFNAAKGPTRFAMEFDQKDIPLWRRYWKEASRAVSDRGVSDLRYSDRTFVLMCMDHFNVLEPAARAKKRVTLMVSKPVKRKAENGSAVSPSKKARKCDSGAGKKSDGFRTTLSCEVPRPRVRGSKDKPCNICGYVIKDVSARMKKAGIRASVTLRCCNKEAHVQCWESSRTDVFKPPSCSAVRWHLKKDRATPIRVPLTLTASQPDEEKFVRCRFCSKLVPTGSRFHLETDCEALRGGNDPPGVQESMIGRLAKKCVTLACEEKSRTEGENPDRARAQTQTARRAVEADSQIT